MRIFESSTTSEIDLDSRMNRVLKAVRDERLLREKTRKVIEGRCWNLNAKCYITKKRLFGRKCIKVITVLAPTTAYELEVAFYFEPKRFTFWQLKG